MIHFSIIINDHYHLCTYPYSIYNLYQFTANVNLGYISYIHDKLFYVDFSELLFIISANLHWTRTYFCQLIFDFCILLKKYHRMWKYLWMWTNDQSLHWSSEAVYTLLKGNISMFVVTFQIHWTEVAERISLNDQTI